MAGGSSLALSFLIYQSFLLSPAVRLRWVDFEKI